MPILRDEAVILRAIEPEDLEVMSLVENDTRLWDCIDTTVPYSTFLLKEYIRRTSCNFYEDREVRMAIALPDGLAVGFIDLRDYEPRHLRAEVGIVLMPEYQHLGLARRALSLLVEYSSRVLHLHQVYAYVQSANHQALRLFKAVGFRQTASLPQWTRCVDGWCDVVVLQMLLEE
ncbi:MAG: GNAT family N-acetyltransferase [Bacteroidaceae bacterium]